jgi:hypothetical protein
MPFGVNQPLLGDFTLEPMSLGAFERKAWVRLLHYRANDGDAVRA